MSFFLNSKPLLADGAMGTQLLGQGCTFSDCLEALNLSEPVRIQTLHKSYIEAGADVIWTHSFGANRFRLASHGLESKVAQINQHAVKNAQLAGAPKIVGCIGPTGLTREQASHMGHSALFTAFCEQVLALQAAGAHALVAETFTSLTEAKIVLKALQTSPLPFAILLSPREDLHLGDGTPLPDAYQSLLSDGLEAFGLNCAPPSVILSAFQALKSLTKRPFLAKPHAGFPAAPICAKDFAKIGQQLVAEGASIIGGCCGSGPDHIKMLKPFLLK